MSKVKVIIFKGGDSLYYWRMTAANGRIIAVGGEGFTRRSNAKKSVKNIIRNNVFYLEDL